MRFKSSEWRALSMCGVLAAALALCGCGSTRTPLTAESLASLRVALPEATAASTIALPPPATTTPEVLPPATFETPAPRVGDNPPPEPDASEVQRGIASFYASYFHGRTTASGELYDEGELSAAHRTLPFGTRVRVTNLHNQRQLVLTITDRGPFVRGRVIDLSREAARRLGFLDRGTIPVEVEVLSP